MTTTNPDALLLPHQLTPATPNQILEALEEAWPSVVGGEPTTEALLVLLAQWGIETGDGRALHNWNLGNAKRVKDQPWTMLDHVWEVIDGRRICFEPPDPQTHFRAFDSLPSGAHAYLTMMRGRFAKSWAFVIAGDPGGFARSLKEQHYYTADVVAYTKALVLRYTAFENSIFPLDVAAALAKLGFASVRAFQEAHGLTVDGIVGPKTRAALRLALKAV